MFDSKSIETEPPKGIWTPEKGAFTQDKFNRLNQTIDRAQKGEKIEIDSSIRTKFDKSSKVVVYPSMGVGDTILVGASYTAALDQYYKLHPNEKPKQLEIVSPFTETIEGLSDKYPWVTTTKVEISPEAAAQNLHQQPDGTFVITSFWLPKYVTALNNARSENTSALVDASIFRLADHLEPWQPQQQPVTTYPARVSRFMEMLLGERMFDDPNSVTANVPVSKNMEIKQREIKQKISNLFGTEDIDLHCLMLSGTVKSKRFSIPQIQDLLIQLANQCSTSEHSADKKPERVMFVTDPDFFKEEKEETLSMYQSLPDSVKQYVKPFAGDLTEVGALESLSTSVISPDTGVGQLASALGKNTLLLYTTADPYLWNTGGNNLRFLASADALEAHKENTPTNLRTWEGSGAMGMSAFSTEQIINGWKKLISK